LNAEIQIQKYLKHKHKNLSWSDMDEGNYINCTARNLNDLYAVIMYLCFWFINAIISYIILHIIFFRIQKNIFSLGNVELQINIFWNKYKLKVLSSTNCTRTTEWKTFIYSALESLPQHWMTVEGEIHAELMQYKTLAHFLQNTDN